MEVSEVTT